MDGPLLLRVDETFARENLGLVHALHRRKLVRAVTELKKTQVRNFKVRSTFFHFFAFVLFNADKRD